MRSRPRSEGGQRQLVATLPSTPQFVVAGEQPDCRQCLPGAGGNIRIQAQQAFLADPASLVSASSTLGINGEVDIQTPVKSISGAVAPLSQAFASAAALLRSPCAARLHEGTVSTLVERGRDGVPATPRWSLAQPAPTGPSGHGRPSPRWRAAERCPVWPQKESQRDPGGPLPLRGWAASVDAIRLLPG